MCYFIVTGDPIEEENDYERQRLINMKRNFAKMLELEKSFGSFDMTQSLSSIPAAPCTTRELSSSDESGSDSEYSCYSDSDSISDSDSEQMCYVTVSTYQEALQLSSSESKSTAFNIPVQEYWNYVDRTFVDKEDNQLYAVDFVVRSSQGCYFFEYVAINDRGKAEENAEELYSSCFEMIAEDSWAEWKDYKKN
jgi:hypothetical protein